MSLISVLYRLISLSSVFLCCSCIETKSLCFCVCFSAWLVCFAKASFSRIKSSFALLSNSMFLRCSSTTLSMRLISSFKSSLLCSLSIFAFSACFSFRNAASFTWIIFFVSRSIFAADSFNFSVSISFCFATSFTLCNSNVISATSLRTRSVLSAYALHSFCAFFTRCSLFLCSSANFWFFSSKFTACAFIREISPCFDSIIDFACINSRSNRSRFVSDFSASSLFARAISFNFAHSHSRSNFFVSAVLALSLCCEIS